MSEREKGESSGTLTTLAPDVLARLFVVRASLSSAALITLAVAVSFRSSTLHLASTAPQIAIVLLAGALFVSVLVTRSAARGHRRAEAAVASIAFEAAALAALLLVTSPFAGVVTIVGPLVVAAYGWSTAPLARVAARAFPTAHALAGTALLLSRTLPSDDAQPEPQHLLALAAAYVAAGYLAYRRTRPSSAREMMMTTTTLEARLKNGPLTLEEATRLCSDVGAELEQAHERALFHHGLGLEDIVVVVEPPLRFLLQPRKNGQEEQQHCWLAPEQASADVAEASALADQFAFAAIVYRALTGTDPFRLSRSPAGVHELLHGVPPPPSSKVFGLPSEIDVVLAIALAKSPMDRFRSTAGFVRAFIAATCNTLDDEARERRRKIADAAAQSKGTITS